MELKFRFSFRIGETEHDHALILSLNDPAHARLNLKPHDLHSPSEVAWEGEHYIRNHLIAPNVTFTSVHMEDEAVLATWHVVLGGVQFSGIEHFAYESLTHDSLPTGTDWTSFLRDHLYLSQETLNVTVKSAREFKVPEPPMEAAYAVKTGSKVKLYAKKSTAKAQITRYANSHYWDYAFPDDCSLWKVGAEGWELIFAADGGQHRSIIPW